MSNNSYARSELVIPGASAALPAVDTNAAPSVPAPVAPDAPALAPVGTPAPALPPHQARLRDGRLVTLRELKAMDEFAIEKILQGEGMSLEGVGQASYLRAIALASIAEIDGREEAPLRHKAQFDRYLNMFSGRDMSTILDAFVRFNGGDDDDATAFRPER